jgi:outer membrane protein TolC
LAPDRPAKAGDNSTDLKILNQRFLNLPETRLPESIFLPGKPLLSTMETPANPALGLLEVVQSVDRSYPPLMIAYQELEVAEGAMVSAAGGFDLAANAAVRNYPLGYYQRFYHEYYLEQPTTYHGVKLFGGYRLGMGQYPVYYWPYRTQAGGEFAAGFEFPLLKGNKIDARRAAVWKAELDRSNVDPTIIKQRIDSINVSSKAYWDWAANGRKFLIAEELMAKARERNIALARQVELGSMPQVELTDNQRILIQRESLRLSSFRKFQQSSINLSLYLRDPMGLPSIPDAARIPTVFPDRLQPEFDQVPASIETALNLRPEMKNLMIKSEKMGIDLRLAENEMLPGVNLYLYGSQDVGAQPPSKNLKFFTMESSILVDVPLQRRYAKGRIRSVQGEISQLRQQIGFTKDTITAEVQDSISALGISFEQVDLLKRSVEVNLALEESERRKYELGNSNILLVNLREQATADSEALVVDAEAEFQRNWADYRAAVGLDAVDFNPNAPRDLKPEAKRDPSALRTRFSKTPKNTTLPK